MGDFDENGVEVWPQVLERALAECLGGYDEIGNGGHSSDVWIALTGQSATRQSVSSLNNDEIAAVLKEKDRATPRKVLWVSTVEYPTLASLPGNHALVAADLQYDSHGKLLKMRLHNPWGPDKQAVYLNAVDFAGNIDSIYWGDPIE